ncbi:MAG: UDP-2,3-diacylglucosamine diphosphatase [Planctomycetota bacterium]|nr:UDP-2,3-diacylglucosamine diphosphatase [Planctomycetota bacterium]
MIGLLAFVADVHLDGADTARHRRFRELLEMLASRAAGGRRVELYSLGDLFQFWYEYRRALFEMYARDLDALEAAASRGVRIHLISGNRDFAYGGYLPGRLGATVHGDGAVIEYAPGRKALACHGDLLCTADRSYLRFRRVIRSRPVAWLFRALPFPLAKAMIGGMMTVSSRKAALERKAGNAPVLDLEEAGRAMDAAGCDKLICGHVHRFAREAIPRTGGSRELICLGSWLEEPNALLCEDGIFRYVAGPFA